MEKRIADSRPPYARIPFCALRAILVGRVAVKERTATLPT